MNRSLLFLLALVACSSIHAQTYFTRKMVGRGPMKPLSEYTKYHIKGTVLNADKSTKLYLSGIINQEIQLKDDNTFELTGEAYSPNVLIIQSGKSNYCFLWVSEGKIDVTLTEYTTPVRDSAKKYIKIVNLTGPSETEIYTLLERRTEELKSDYERIALPARLDSVAAAIYPEVAEYITNNSRSALALTLLKKYNFTVDQKQALLATMDRDVNPMLYDDYKQTLKRTALLRRGTVLPNFRQKMPDDTEFNLYSVKARYILLQFWDSECDECRLTNTTLLDLYARYHPMGLEIVYVSLDTRKKAWKTAVTEDALPWKQVSDLKGRKNAIASEYKIDTAPFSILLNDRYHVVDEAQFTPLIVAKINQLFK